jgi:crotonobetainyl-CoA:carnitine CoA-transferase CaiB-like acyl-CoA transferase
VPSNLLGTPGAIQGGQPLPGEHNTEIFGLMGYSDAEIAAFSGEAV